MAKPSTPPRNSSPPPRFIPPSPRRWSCGTCGITIPAADMRAHLMGPDHARALGVLERVWLEDLYPGPDAPPLTPPPSVKAAPRVNPKRKPKPKLRAGGAGGADNVRGRAEAPAPPPPRKTKPRPQVKVKVPENGPAAQAPPAVRAISAPDSAQQPRPLTPSAGGAAAPPPPPPPQGRPRGRGANAKQAPSGGARAAGARAAVPRPQAQALTAVGDPAPPPTSRQTQPGAKAKKQSAAWTCTVCVMSMSIQSMDSHLAGRRHIRAAGLGSGAGPSGGGGPTGPAPFRERRQRDWGLTRSEADNLIYLIDTAFGCLPEGGAYKESNFYSPEGYIIG